MRTSLRRVRGAVLLASLPILTTCGGDAPTGNGNAEPSRLSFQVQPTAVEVTTPITPAVVVVVLDASGNPAKAGSAAVTLTLSGSGGGTLGGTRTRSTTQGVATFDDLTVSEVGADYALDATATSLTGAKSAAFAVHPGAPAKLVFRIHPSNAPAGEPFATQVQVEVQDTHGKVVTDATTTIALAVTAGTGSTGAALDGTCHRAAVAGVATFDDIHVHLVGTGYTLTATASGLTSAVSGAFNVLDVLSPTVVLRTPAASATDVAIGTTVTVVFSEPVDSTTITATSFALSPSVTGTFAVTGATAVFTPSAPLGYNTVYTVSLSSSIKDPSGNALTADTWTFHTVPNLAPTAHAGADADAARGASVTLDARASSDPESEALTYQWTQLGGTAVGALTGAQPTFTAPAGVTTLLFGLTVTDTYGNTSTPDVVTVWVLEDPAKTIWVSLGGNDGNPGTRAAPMLTIGAAITAASAAGGDVYVSTGTFNGALTLADGVSIYGGYDNAWRRDGGARTTIAAPPVGGTVFGVIGSNVSNLALDALEVTTPAASTPGATVYGIYLASGTGITMTNLAILAGDGVTGPDGAAGSNGVTGESGYDGANGSCDYSPPGSGGGGGQLTIGSVNVSGGNGGRGGLEGANAGVAGGGGNPIGNGGGTGGHGGGGGDPGASGGTGSSGANGADGTHGAAGVASTPFTLFLGFYFLPGDGGDGAAGTPGAGGGGGGGGGGQGALFVDNGSGNGGGGGGSGGGYGTGGAHGIGGGGSFGLFAVNSSVTITQSTIATGRGGNGGSGGTGGTGMNGGLGGRGAVFCTAEIGRGGNGGDGGKGGNGGHGGGGAGGPSIGIYTQNSTLTQSGNTFVLGVPGNGGGSSGNAGQGGVSAEVSSN